MNEFKVNELITLKLEDGKTIIYVDDEEFRQCKYLLLDIPIEQASSFDEIESIDEAAEKLDHSEEPREKHVSQIPPEVEFWGHCSNLQAWYENDYDSRLLHSNLAFPLLKELLILGDLIAERVISEEIAKRLMNGTFSTVRYLLVEEYFDLLRDEEVQAMISGDIKKRKKEKITFKHEQMNLDSLAEDIHGMTLKQFNFLINHPKFDFLEDFQEHINEIIENRTFDDSEYITDIFNKLLDLERKKMLEYKYLPLLEKLKERV